MKGPVAEAVGGEIKRYPAAGQDIDRVLHRMMARIAGHHSDQIIELLGYAYGPVVVHRNDMILL